MNRARRVLRLLEAVDALRETQNGKSYGVVYLKAPATITGIVKGMQGRIKEEHLGGDGLEKDLHITVKYGLETDDPDKVMPVLKGQAGPVTITFGSTSVFPPSEGSDGCDVVKIDIDSPDLQRLHTALSKLSNADSHPVYKPHLTVAYVKAGCGRYYADMNDLAGRTMRVPELIFSDKNEKKTSAVLLWDRPAPPR